MATKPTVARRAPLTLNAMPKWKGMDAEAWGTMTADQQKALLADPTAQAKWEAQFGDTTVSLEETAGTDQPTSVPITTSIAIAPLRQRSSEAGAKAATSTELDDLLYQGALKKKEVDFIPTEVLFLIAGRIPGIKANAGTAIFTKAELMAMPIAGSTQKEKYKDVAWPVGYNGPYDRYTVRKNGKNVPGSYFGDIVLALPSGAKLRDEMHALDMWKDNLPGTPAWCKEIKKSGNDWNDAYKTRQDLLNLMTKNFRIAVMTYQQLVTLDEKFSRDHVTVSIIVDATTGKPTPRTLPVVLFDATTKDDAVIERRGYTPSGLNLLDLDKALALGGTWQNIVDSTRRGAQEDDEKAKAMDIADCEVQIFRLSKYLSDKTSRAFLAGRLANKGETGEALLVAFGELVAEAQTVLTPHANRLGEINVRVNAAEAAEKAAKLAAHAA